MMASEPASFPFSAVVGQEDLKLALTLNAISPKVGGVLVQGEKGNAKSTTARAFAALLAPREMRGDCRYGCDPQSPFAFCPTCTGPNPGPIIERPARLVELPLGATEERVLGHLDLEAALTESRRQFEPGLLALAHRGVLYVDEVNLLEDHLVDLVLDAAASGVVRVERDQFSVLYPAQFVLVGTMNPEEGELRPQLLDRFGLSVQVATPDKLSDRVAVVERRLAFNRQPAAFSLAWQEKDEWERTRIIDARRRLATVVLPPDLLVYMATLCMRAGAEGLRADIVLAEAALALAAYRGHLEVTPEDVLEVAPMVLRHRAKIDWNPPDPSRRSPSPTERLPLDAPLPAPSASSRRDPDNAPISGSRSEDGPEGHGEPSEAQSSALEAVLAPERVDSAWPLNRRPSRRRHPIVAVALASSSFRRSHGLAQDRGFVYASRGIVERVLPIPGWPERFGPPRVGWGLSLTRMAVRQALVPVSSVEPRRMIYADLTGQVRRQRRRALYVFMIDSSASMAGYRRMNRTKGLVLQTARRLYQRRASFAVIAFRKDGAYVLLAPSNKVERLEKALEGLATGGNTPLAAGLALAKTSLTQWTIKNRAWAPELILVTDGRVNSGGALSLSPRARAVHLGRQIVVSGVPMTVIDAEWGPVRLGSARSLAQDMGAAIMAWPSADLA